MNERNPFWRPITSHPDILGGTWCITGTRIAAVTIKRFSEDGYSTERIIKEYPDLTPEQVDHALAFVEPRESDNAELVKRLLAQADIGLKWAFCAEAAVALKAAEARMSHKTGQAGASCVQISDDQMRGSQRG